MGLDVLEVKNGHPDIALAVQDARVSSLSRKTAYSLDEDVLIKRVEVGSVIKTDYIVIATLNT